MLRRGLIAGIAVGALTVAAWAATEATDVSGGVLQGVVVDTAGKPTPIPR